MASKSCAQDIGWSGAAGSMRTECYWQLAAGAANAAMDARDAEQELDRLLKLSVASIFSLTWRWEFG